MKLLPKLPKGWTQVTLGDISSFIQYGLTAKGEEDIDGVFFLRITNINNDGSVNQDKHKQVSSNTPKLDKYILEPGDLVIARSGSVGLSFVYQGSENPWVFASYLIRFRLKKMLVFPEYIGFYLRSSYYWHYINSMTKVVAQPNINSQEFSRLPIPLPPISEQRRIAQILREADELRKLRQQANERAQQFLPALFYDMFGNPLTNERSWETQPIKNIGQVITGNTPPRNNPENYGDFIEWIKSDNLESPIGLVTPSKEMLSEKGSQIGRIASKGSTLITCIAGSPDVIGRTALTDRDVAFNQQINAVQPFESTAPYYLYGVLTLSRTAIQRLSSGGMKGIVNKSQLENMDVISPPKELQDEFAIKASKIFEIKTFNVNSLNQIETLFQSLLSHAFTGKLTANWRKDHDLDVSFEALERELRFEDYGITPLEQPDIALCAADVGMEDREELFATLSEEQQYMIQSIVSKPSYMTTPPLLIDREEPLSPHMQHHGLNLLGTAGVVAQILLRIIPTNNIAFYPTTYRNLSTEDDSRDNDLDILKEVTL